MQSSVIGKIVTVTVDRPMGSYHPEHKDMYYPVNYGYIEGIIAPDGEEQDAFTKFDPKFSLPFLKNVATSYIGNNVKLSDGRTGEVVLINGHALSRPIVKCEGNEFVDLSKERNLEIVAVLQ